MRRASTARQGSNQYQQRAADAARWTSKRGVSSDLSAAVEHLGLDSAEVAAAAFAPDSDASWEALLPRAESVWRQQFGSVIDALPWTETGIGPWDSAVWFRRGTPIPEAIAWTDAGWGAQSAGTWIDEGFSYGEAQRWNRTGLTAFDAGPVRRAGVTVGDAARFCVVGVPSWQIAGWWKAGFGADQAGMWTHYKADLSEAIRLRTAGVIDPAEHYIAKRRGQHSDEGTEEIEASAKFAGRQRQHTTLMRFTGNEGALREGTTFGSNWEAIVERGNGTTTVYLTSDSFGGLISAASEHGVTSKHDESPERDGGYIERSIDPGLVSLMKDCTPDDQSGTPVREAAVWADAGYTCRAALIHVSPWQDRVPPG